MRRVVLAVLVLTCAALGGLARVDAAAGGYRVIAHHEVKGAKISRENLSSIFLKQAPRWIDGSAIVPVDQSVRSDVRKSFSGGVLLQGVAEVQIYWQRRMSQGMLPPPVKATDQDVVAFVGSTPGAIGYVSTVTPLPESVKTIEVAD